MLSLLGEPAYPAQVTLKMVREHELHSLELADRSSGSPRLQPSRLRARLGGRTTALDPKGDILFSGR